MGIVSHYENGKLIKEEVTENIWYCRFCSEDNDASAYVCRNCGVPQVK